MLKPILKNKQLFLNPGLQLSAIRVPLNPLKGTSTYPLTPFLAKDRGKGFRGLRPLVFVVVLEGDSNLIHGYLKCPFAPWPFDDLFGLLLGFEHFSKTLERFLSFVVS